MPQDPHSSESRPTETENVTGVPASELISHQLMGFSQEAPARLLIDYLNSQRLPAHLVTLTGEQKDAPYPFVIAIKNESQIPEALAICQSFLNNPSDKRFQSAAWETGQTMQTSQPVLPSSSEFFKQLLVAPVAFVVVMLCVVVYAAFNLDSAMVFQALHFQPAETLLETGQWWRLWSPAVIHLSILHIVFNLLWWWSLGKDFERIFGHFFIAAFFLVTALLSNYGQFLVSGSGFGGLSGVVYAMFGCVWWLGWLRPQWGLQLSKPVIGFMLFWLVLGYIDVLFISMANTAHTVGLLSGCIIALILTRIKPR